MVGDTRQGWAVLAAMTIIFIPFMLLAVVAEQNGNPSLTPLGVDQTASDLQAGGNMEGKEVRFGIANSALWASATTAASNGSVNSMHDSFTPLGGFVPIWLLHLSEVIYGGVGSGLYGMLAFVIVAVFVAGLMVGRTPEYLGKKIESYEMKMATLMILIPPAVVLLGTALTVMTTAGKGALFNPDFPYTTIYNPGPHGFSEALYAYSSMGNNNGSAFAGFGANNPFHNLLGGVVMLFARYWLLIPILAIAGSLARKKKVPESLGTIPTHTPLFVGWLIAVVIIVGALNFIPALALGPFVEHLLMNQGVTF
jgi:K+-transporting ATPase ATPase A chain